MSAQDAERLRVALDAEADLYERMRDLLQEEREVLFCLDPVRLEELTRRKAELADEGRVLEDGRRTVTRLLSQRFSLPEHVRLSELCDRLGTEHEALRATHNRLIILVSVVKELLDANRGLTGQSLAEVKATVEVLGGLLPDRGPYGHDGASGSGTGRLLRRTA